MAETALTAPALPECASMEGVRVFGCGGPTRAGQQDLQVEGRRPVPDGSNPASGESRNSGADPGGCVVAGPAVGGASGGLERGHRVLKSSSSGVSRAWARACQVFRVPMVRPCSISMTVRLARPLRAASSS